MQKLIHLHARRSMASPPPYAKIARHLSMTGFADETGQIILNEAVSNLSRFTGRAHEHEGKLIVLIIVILWKGDQPIDL
jgi:hypothetical protein